MIIKIVVMISASTMLCNTSVLYVLHFYPLDCGRGSEGQSRHCDGGGSQKPGQEGRRMLMSGFLAWLMETAH